MVNESAAIHSTRRIVNYPKLSVQLYTVREAMQDDLGGSLARIAEIGYTQVEPYNFPNVDGLGEALAAAGLTAPTGHAHYLGEDDAELNRVFASAKALGIGLAIDPHVPTERWQSEEDVRAIAEQLNAAAVIAANYDVAVGYHNHGHELASHFGDQTAFEFFAGLLDPAVRLEVDTYWVVVGGEDPVALLGRLGAQVAAIHVKDGAGTTEVKDQTAVGAGSLPIRAIIEAAPNALRVVELDDSHTDRFQAVAESFAWLVKEDLA
jgi:sugar phosphate isomerase/epimerase